MIHETEQQAKLESLKLSKKIEQKLHSRNFTKFGFDLNPVVSGAAGIIIFLFSAFAFLDLEQANKIFAWLNSTIVSNFDWLFLLSANLFILVSLVFAFSKLGKIRLGGVGTKPEFDDFSWYSMLISAGMGIGLMFWSVGEPLYHKNITPPIFQSSDSTTQALATTFFHWGIHPWGIYALLSLALAFFAYNKKLPLSLRSVFYPILKDKIFGVWGDLIDVLAVVSCLFGLATSLGLGVQQINSGLNYLFGVGINTYVQVGLIVVISLIATASVVSGIDKGVKILSKGNIILAMILMVLVFLLGPTAFIVREFSNSFGLYLNDFLKATFYIGEKNATWQGSWTVFYLAWWISWSPFVSMFIAKISKGRTIREFVLAVMVVPALVSFIWLTVFGATAIDVNSITDGALFAVTKSNVSVALFEMIKHLNIPLLAGLIKTGLSVLGTVLVISFFVTSSDSGSLVVDQITSGGKHDSPVRQRVFWAFLQGLTAIVLLLIGGEKALLALQTAVITTGLPFVIILLMVAYTMIDSLSKAHKKQQYIRDTEKFEALMEEYIQDDEDSDTDTELANYINNLKEVELEETKALIKAEIRRHQEENKELIPIKEKNNK